MSSVVIAGDTSGSVTLQAPAVAGTTTLTLPAVSGTVMAPATAGTSGQLLTSAGTGAAPTWTTPSAGALTFLATVTPTVATSVQSLNVFTSTYDNYYIVLNNIATNSTSDTVLAMRFAVGGAVDSTTSYWNYSNGGTTGNASSQCEILGGSGTVHNSNSNITMAIELNNVNSTLTNSFRYFSYGGVYSNNSLGGDTTMFIGAGAFKGTSVLTGFSFYFNSGATFKAQGNIRIYGYANS